MGEISSSFAYFITFLNERQDFNRHGGRFDQKTMQIIGTIYRSVSVSHSSFSNMRLCYIHDNKQKVFNMNIMYKAPPL